MATECVSLAATPLAGGIVSFVEYGALLTRNQVMKFRNADVETYRQAQFDYLANRGVAVTELSEWHMKARGA